MKQKLIKTIKTEINKRTNTIFNLSNLKVTLPDYSYASIKRTINELSHTGYIKNIARGLYFKPRYIKELNTYTVPTCEEFANAVANKNKWSISLSGYCALNALGLTTQVPCSYIYVSTGPNKLYKFNNVQIQFKHCKARELVNYSDETKLLIQALKTLGKNKVTSNVINTLKSLYPQNTKLKILKESAGTTIWIHEKIIQICQ